MVLVAETATDVAAMVRQDEQVARAHVRQGVAGEAVLDIDFEGQGVELYGASDGGFTIGGDLESIAMLIEAAQRVLQVARERLTVAVV